VNRIALFRRRQLWLPTLWCWLALVAWLAAAGPLFGRNLWSFLAADDPLPQARLLVVEGWVDDAQLDQAIAAFHDGRIKRVVTTGGPLDARLKLTGKSTYAELAADYLSTHGIDARRVTPVPAPASAHDRPYLSAVMIRKWAAQNSIKLTALDVFTSGVHARRLRVLYRMAFGPRVGVGVRAARSNDFDERHWWRSSDGAKEVFGETVKLHHTILFFILLRMADTRRCGAHRPMPGGIWERRRTA